MILLFASTFVLGVMLMWIGYQRERAGEIYERLEKHLNN